MARSFYVRRMDGHHAKVSPANVCTRGLLFSPVSGLFLIDARGGARHDHQVSGVLKKYEFQPATSRPCTLLQDGSYDELRWLCGVGWVAWCAYWLFKDGGEAMIGSAGDG